MKLVDLKFEILSVDWDWIFPDFIDTV